MRTSVNWVSAASAALMVFASPSASAQLPSLDQVLDRHIQAIGGRTALSKAGAVLLEGRCESTAPDESGPVEILVQTPKVAYSLNAGSLRMGFDGESVWRATASEGLQQRKGRQFAERVTVFDASRALLWKQWYPEIAVTGIQKIGDREAYVLETHPGQPAAEKLFIDRQSGLLMRDELLPQLSFTFSDYREVDGVRTAFGVQQTTPAGITYTYRFSSIRRVAAADASRFQPK